MLESYRQPNDGRDRAGSNRRAAPQGPVLVAEPVLENARRLVQSLTALRLQVRVAMSPEDVLDLLRHEIFSAAVVASEMTLDGEPIVARLSRLPMLQRIVTLGDAGNAEAEIEARQSGTHVHLARPVTPEMLARALAMPGRTGSRSPIA
jgi:CheY-like chemotaxis protein